jgi:hypothetical protein
MSNPFEELADKQIPAPRKSILKGVETRRANKKLEKKLADDDILFRQWKKWHDERKANLLDGPYREAITKLSSYLENMQLSDGPQLVRFLKQSELRMADEDTRFETLSMCSLAITYLREKVGLNPFDDPLPGQPDDIFQLIKKELI